MPPNILATLVTTTSYGTWLPGDARGHVQDGTVLPPNPALHAHAKSLCKNPPVSFTSAEQDALFVALVMAAEEFDYRMSDVSVESWHLHWIVDPACDAVHAMVGRLKTRMRQRLNRGRIWTEGYCHRCLGSEGEVVVAREYIARHAGCRLADGVRVRRAGVHRAAAK